MADELREAWQQRWGGRGSLAVQTIDRRGHRPSVAWEEEELEADDDTDYPVNKLPSLQLPRMPTMSLFHKHDGSAMLPATATHILLYLNDDTFVGPNGQKLAHEVRVIRKEARVPVVLVHEADPLRGGCAFDRLFHTTPEDLITNGLYKKIAIACKPEPLRDVSMALVGRAFGATLSQHVLRRLVTVPVKALRSSLRESRWTSERSLRESRRASEQRDASPATADAHFTSSTGERDPFPGVEMQGSNVGKIRKAKQLLPLDLTHQRLKVNPFRSLSPQFKARAASTNDDQQLLSATEVPPAEGPAGAEVPPADGDDESPPKLVTRSLSEPEGCEKQKGSKAGVKEPIDLHRSRSVGNSPCKGAGPSKSHGGDFSTKLGTVGESKSLLEEEQEPEPEAGLRI